MASVHSKGRTMIYHDDDYLSTVVPRFPSLTARISANGEPHRRIWNAEVNWRIRDGLLHGKMELTNKWLSGLLRQLAAIENGLFTIGTGSTDEPELIIAHGRDLHRSILVTATRYCSDLKIGISSKMKKA